MKIVVRKRNLNKSEINVLSKETRVSLHMGFIEPKIWKKFRTTYVIEQNNKLAGVCVVVSFGNWLKLGPLLILSEHQGKRIGSILLKKVVEKNTNANQYIGSSNPKILKMVNRLGFNRTRFISLPREIKRYLLISLFKTYSLSYFIDSAIKKIKFGMKPYTFFTKIKNI